MNNGGSPGCGFRFGSYEIRLAPRELYKDGVRIRLQEKPFQVLELLVEKAGTTVTREEFRHRMWSADTHVEFDANLNAALTKLRQALDESAENPRYIETVSRMGYRFTAGVEALENGNGPALASVPQTSLIEKKMVAAARAEHGESRMSRPGAWFRRILLIIPAVIALMLLYPYANRSVAPRQAMGSSRKAMLLVLPFANLSDESSDQSLRDGLTDELISQIGAANSEKLTVIPRLPAINDEEARETAIKYGSELGADYVLDGSMRRENGRVKISASLARAQSKARICAHTYEGSPGDLPRIQSELARNVADALAPELMSRPLPGASHSAIQNAESYSAYLEGRIYWSKRSRSSLQRAQELFSQSVLRDPQFALGYAGLADTYLVMTDWLVKSPEEGYAHARLAAQKALGLNDSLGSAHAVLAAISWYHDRSWPQAEAEFRLAISLDPANATIHQWYAEALGSRGKTEEALAEIRRAHELDPLSLMIMAAESNLLYMARRYPQAIETARKVVEMDASFPPAYCFLYHGYLALGRHSEAVNAYLKCMELNGASEEYGAALRRALERGGVRSVWQLSLKDLTEREDREYVSPVEKAVLELRLGDRPAALNDLERSFATGDGRLGWIKMDPALDQLRDEPRFKQLLHQMHLDS